MPYLVRHGSLAWLVSKKRLEVVPRALLTSWEHRRSIDVSLCFMQGHSRFLESLQKVLSAGASATAAQDLGYRRRA